MRKRRSVTIVVNAAIFILLEFAAIALLKSTSSLQDIWVTRASQQVSASFWGGIEDLTDYFSLRKENQRLAEENENLLIKLRAYQLIEEENKEKDNCYEGSNDVFDFIPAGVVKMGINTAHNFVVLNKGSEDGVKAQTGIISSKGVVGIITSVDKHYSYGISFLNSNLKVSCRVGTDDVQALLSWNGKEKNKAFLDDIPPHSIINPGDTVRTSGLSTLFPADIPVGVAEKTRIVDGTSIQVVVDLFQDFQSLRYVTIASHKDIDVISQLEKNNK